MIRIAEVDFDPEKCLKFLVMLEQDVVVRREGAHFRIPLLDPEKCFVNFRNRDREYQLEKGYSQFPIDNDKENAMTAFSGNNEVCFRIAASCSFVYVLRSLTDEYSVIKLLQFCASPLFSSSLLLSMSFNISPVRAPDVAIDALF